MKNRIKTEFGSLKRDHEICDAIRRRLDHQGHDGLRRVRCSVQQGTAVLWGFVATEADRELACRLVDECASVEGVIDNIQLNSVRSASEPALLS